LTREITIYHLSTNYHLTVDHYPSECGICHKSIDPSFIGGALVKGDFGNLGEVYFEAVFQCTNPNCKKLIIGAYKKNEGTSLYNLTSIAPIHPQDKEFNSEIKEVSPNFMLIYNQSLNAEQTGLDLISGIGYRKAIEFLIKDYLVYLEADEEEKILKMPLGQCINLLENPIIKEISKRATWIGNDEAHYSRKWENKDINYLKKLIEVTVYYIAMDVSGRKYLEEMK
jgi:hypothetical protein